MLKDKFQRELTPGQVIVFPYERLFGTPNLEAVIEAVGAALTLPGHQVPQQRLVIACKLTMDVQLLGDGTIREIYVVKQPDEVARKSIVEA